MSTWSDKNFEAFSYDKEEIEMTNSYIYLGTTFSNSAVFKKATNDMVGKALIAMNSTLKIVRTSKAEI